jgi:hypothetical protein
MIVVVGRVAATAGETPNVSGLAGAIAMAAATAGRRVELVAKLGDDPAGDQVLLALNRARVGHAAVLRDPARPTPIVEDVATDGNPADEASAADDLLGGELLADPIAAPAASDPGAERPGLDLAPADLELALRYLTDAAVIVLADPAAALVPIAADGAGFSGAALVIAGDAAALPSGDDVAGATVLAAPANDPGGAFPALVGGYAAELDAGQDPSSAWEAAIRRIGAERT